VNHAKNFKIKNIIFRITAFVIYFAASGLAAVSCHTIFNSFLRIVLRNSPILKDIILYLISLCVIFAALYFFSLREGAADTQDLRFSILKTVICYFAAGIIFFMILIFADSSIFGQEHFFKEYFFSPYYADEHIRSFTRASPENKSYVISAVIILLNILAMIIAYKAGRANWIARKRKQVEELRKKARH
jgi:hypothetical protein